MPLITPPSDEPFVPETIDEPKASQEEVYWRYRKTVLYLDCQNWKCSECGTTVFGRCKTCPYCRYKLGKITNRPDTWKAHSDDAQN